MLQKATFRCPKLWMPNKMRLREFSACCWTRFNVRRTWPTQRPVGDPISGVLRPALLKARDVMRHYVGVVMPEGFKAQVVASTRRAAVTYREKLLKARDELVSRLETIPGDILWLGEDELARLDVETRWLVRAHSSLDALRAVDIAVVISGDHNDPESWRDWSDKEKQKDYTTRFKRRLAPDRTDKTDPLSMLVVN